MSSYKIIKRTAKALVRKPWDPSRRALGQIVGLDSLFVVVPASKTSQRFSARVPGSDPVCPCLGFPVPSASQPDLLVPTLFISALP